jgi:hypothetical protein
VPGCAITTPVSLSSKVFDGKLETLLGELADEVWNDAG